MNRETSQERTVNNMDPKEQEKQMDEQFLKDYTKKVFAFNSEELKEIQPMEEVTKLINTLILVGGMAQRAKDNYVGSTVMKRLGIKISPDVKMNYLLEENRIVVYEPKVWCSVCGVRKAEYENKAKQQFYCESCAEKAKQELKIAEPIQPEVKEEVPVEEPKKEKKNHKKSN